jgi:sigma-B regulation protein RsbU (phosphoserine phosphatase)
MRPLLTDGGPAVPRAGRLSHWRAFLIDTWRGRVLAVALAAWLLDRLLSLAGLRLPEPLAILARVVLVPYAVWAVWRLFRWVSDRLLWRIRTKLILSYLFIALVPVILLSLFMLVAGVLLLGLTASRVVTDEIEREGAVLQTTARSALAGLPATDAEAAKRVETQLAPLRAAYPRLGWTLLRNGRVVSSAGDAPRTLPGWWKGPGFAGLVRLDPEARLSPEVLRAVWADKDAALVLDVPADRDFLGAIEKRTGIHVIGPDEMDVVVDEDTGRREKIRLRHGSGAELAGAGKQGSARSHGGLAFVAFPEKTNWQTGERSPFAGLPLAFQFDGLDLVRRLSPGLLPREAGARSLPDLMIYLLGILGAVFVVMYAVALALGLSLARSITRGVHALSVGTQRLRQGDFSHVIAVRSRDQLGELAESFNHMSRGIQQLMLEQAEKQRLEEELRIARQIQMSLLPGEALVRVPGVRVAALCLPAAEVGGDYYDLLPLGPSRMGVLVADVSGKGTSAALYMAELKGLVLSLSRIYDSPARLLAEANRILFANMDARSFVTMTYAVVDTLEQRMRYARAGHNPMIHLEARTGRTRVLAPPGLGLGLDPGERFEKILQEDSVRLEEGDFFLFFTDGLSEAMNERAELFGESRLRTILERSEGLGSEELKLRIWDEVRSFVGDATPHDDMTLVVLKVVAESRAA